MIPITKPYLDSKEENLVSEVLRSGWLTQGPKVIEFENRVAEYVNAKYAVAVTSCSTALFLALKALGIKESDEVIVPSYSFIATANAVVHAGATPVFADIDRQTYNVSSLSIEKIIESGYVLDLSMNELVNKVTSNRLRAIIPVHQVGLPAEIDSIIELADKYGLHVIEDAACAIGSEYKGKKIGGHSDMICFSFHPRKIITTGEGGAVTTNSIEYAEKLRSMRQHCMTVSDLNRHQSDHAIFESYPEVGYNYRMSDIQAAVGIAQMDKIEDIIRKRIAVAKVYNQSFEGHSYLEISNLPEGYRHTYQSYLLKVKKNSPISREDIVIRLLNRGISARRGIMAIHKEQAYCRIKNIIDLPITEECADTTFIIPLYPQMTGQEIEYVISEIKRCFE